MCEEPGMSRCSFAGRSFLWLWWNRQRRDTSVLALYRLKDLQVPPFVGMVP